MLETAVNCIVRDRGHQFGKYCIIVKIDLAKTGITVRYNVC